MERNAKPHACSGCTVSSPPDRIRLRLLRCSCRAVRLLLLRHQQIQNALHIVGRGEGNLDFAVLVISSNGDLRIKMLFEIMSNRRIVPRIRRLGFPLLLRIALQGFHRDDFFRTAYGQSFGNDSIGEFLHLLFTA